MKKKNVCMLILLCVMRLFRCHRRQNKTGYEVMFHFSEMHAKSGPNEMV